MQERLATDLTLQPLLARFVSVHIDSDSDAWQKWEQKFPSKSDSIPILYVIRADGESLYAQSGSLPGLALNQMLTEMLGKSGALLNETQLKKLAEGVAKATQAYERGDVADAVLAATKLSGSGSYAEAALTADALAKKLADEAQQKIKAAEGKLEDESTALAGAVELAAVNRIYKKLPGVIKAVKETSAKFTIDAEARELFAQAGLLDRAKAFAQQRQTAKAAAAYEQVLEKYPDGEAAKLARTELEELGPIAGSGSGKRPDGGSASPSEKAKKAASLLKMAKVFAKSKPDKARECAEQVLELAPDTPQAEEAQSLIESLEKP